MKLADILKAAERLAPPKLAVPDDPIGLHTGNPESDIDRVLVCLDATGEMWTQAARMGAGAILCHHPLIYNPVTSLAETSPSARLLCQVVRQGLAVYSLHTNWDSAPDGLNDALAVALGMTATEPLEIVYTEKRYKLAVFVPQDALDNVRMAIGDAGAGSLGNYTHCSFRAQGTGAFRPVEGARPHIGEVGRLEDVNEWRLEALVAEDCLHEVLAAMLSAHPYEEVAYDLFPVQPDGKQYGIGRVGRLEAPVSLSGVMGRVSGALGDPPLRFRGDLDRMIETLAVCGGGGGGLVQLASDKGADAYVTSDVRHDQLLLADSLGLAIVDATHQATESFGMRHFAQRLQQELSADVDVVFLES